MSKRRAEKEEFDESVEVEGSEEEVEENETDAQDEELTMEELEARLYLPNGDNDFSIRALMAYIIIKGLELVGTYTESSARALITIVCKGFAGLQPGEECEKEVTKSFCDLRKSEVFCCKFCICRDKYKDKTPKDGITWIYGYEREAVCKLEELFGLKVNWDKIPTKTNQNTTIEFKCKGSDCNKVIRKQFCNIVMYRVFYCAKCKPTTRRISWTAELLINFAREHNLVLRLKEHEYKAMKISNHTIIEFRCINTCCNEWTSRKFGNLYRNKQFYCANCHHGSKGQICFNRVALDKFILEEGLKLAKNPGAYVHAHTEIHIKCKIGDCNIVVVKKFKEFYVHRIFECTVCVTQGTSKHNVFTKELYRNFANEFNINFFGKNEYIYPNRIMIGECNTVGCYNLFFKPLDKLYITKLPFCPVCSYIMECNRNAKDMYDKTAVEKIFAKHNVTNFSFHDLTNEEDFLNRTVEFQCKNIRCNNICSRTALCVVETENLYCGKCPRIKIVDQVEYNKGSFSDIIPVLYPFQKFDPPEDTDENTIFEFKCDHKRCKNYLKRTFKQMVDRQEIYCDEHSNDETFFDKQLRLFIGKTSAKLFKRYRNVGQYEYVKGYCMTPNCDNTYKKTLDAINITELPYCQGCTGQLKVRKIRDVMLAKYKCDHNMRHPVLARKNQESAGSRKTYIAPKGKIFSYMGYEDRALKILFTKQGYDENDVFTELDEVPPVDYFFTGGSHRYYTDIYIPKEKRCIEVKSTYYYTWELEQNWAKHDATIEAGYKHEIWILNDAGEILNIFHKREDDPDYVEISEE